MDKWNELGDNEKVVIVMDRVCRHEAVARAIEIKWKKRCVASVAVPHQP